LLAMFFLAPCHHRRSTLSHVLDMDTGSGKFPFSSGALTPARSSISEKATGNNNYLASLLRYSIISSHSSRPSQRSSWSLYGIPPVMPQRSTPSPPLSSREEYTGMTPSPDQLAKTVVSSLPRAAWKEHGQRLDGCVNKRK
jgi:hypothetical protein